jgi:hypothetical protein
MLTHYLSTMQERLQLGDRDFAQQIGVDAETWQALRAGQMVYSPIILARLLVRVPNAHSLALEEFRLQETAGILHALGDALADATARAYAA